MYEPFRINYRPHSTVSIPCPSIYPPAVPRHVQIFLISPPHSSHQPALYYRSGPRAATPPPHTNAPLPPVLYLKRNASHLFPSEQKTSRLPTTGKTAHFYVTRSGVGIGILARPTTIQTSLRSRTPGQETATLRDRGHTGPQSPAGRSGLQPGRDCKACAADPSFRFRRVFSFRR